MVNDAAYTLGRKILGPVFANFAQLLLRHCRHRNCTHLAFVARDGDLLLRTTAAFASRIGETKDLSLSYLHLSRRSTNLPACRTITAETLAGTRRIRAGTGSLREALDYLGMQPALLTSVFTRLGIDPEHHLDDAARKLTDDEEFRAIVSREYQHQKNLLAAYLASCGLNRTQSAILVDIGWKGSIQHNLRAAFQTDRTFGEIPWAYFGLWTEGDARSLPQDNGVGLISDGNRGRNVLEGAAWYAGFLLEATCRANEGTTLGYARSSETIAPVLAGQSPSRAAEEETAGIANAIRQGIFASLANDDVYRPEATDGELRRAAQRSLFRLAFFPTRDEIACGSVLSHTEAHTEAWSMPLVARMQPNPLISPRCWMAGLSSPWRAGYIRSTGGPLLAGAFLLAESTLLALPPTIRTRLTAAGRRFARTGDSNPG